eukprot:COSAG01_NODE_56091_length_320_cov_2.678733_1_plen_40_part_10
MEGTHIGVCHHTWPGLRTIVSPDLSIAVYSARCTAVIGMV